MVELLPSCDVVPALLLHAQGAPELAAASAVPTVAAGAFTAGTTRAELVEWFVGCALFVVGSSLLLRPRAWITAFMTLGPHPAVPLVGGLYALLTGLVVVLLHNVWVTDARVLVTVVGWIAVATGVVLLTAPEVYAVVMRKLPITPQLVALRGLVRMALGGIVLGYLLS